MGFVGDRDDLLMETEACWSYSQKAMLDLDTASWRTERPVFDYEKCNHCGFCFVFCPPQCIREEGADFVVTLEYCKGCGVCAKECPRNAISMRPEGDYADDCGIR